VEWPVLTQRESLVTQADVGLGGGGGLTQGADSYTSLSVAPVPCGLGAPLDKLGPVEVTHTWRGFLCVRLRVLRVSPDCLAAA
jgi:hypothetical protein